MGQVLKAFMGIFFMTVFMLLGTGILVAQMEVIKAMDYKTDMIIQLENSNYNCEVMNACIRQAKECGYDVEIKVYVQGEGTVSYTTPAVTDTKGVEMAEVKLTYPYRIGFFAGEQRQQIRGFAR